MTKLFRKNNMLSIFNRYRAYLRWLPAICIAIGIFFFSATPGDEVRQSYHNLEAAVQSLSPVVPASAVTSPALPAIDWLKVGHGIGYFWLGFTMLYALFLDSHWAPVKALMLCSLYAVTDEFHQSFVPARYASLKDVLIDAFAALAGVATMLGIIKLGAVFYSKDIYDNQSNNQPKVKSESD